MRHLKTFQRKKIVALMLMITIVMAALFGRLIYLMVFRSVYYEKIAQDLHERERSIKAARGKIVDRNWIVLADNNDIGDPQSDRGSGARDRSAAKGTGTSGGDDPKKSGKKQFH